jgi:hypothetical protein
MDNERTFSVDFPESDWNIIVELLMQREKVCHKNARMAIQNGYQTTGSQIKSEEWTKKAAHLNNMLQTIQDKAL